MSETIDKSQEALLARFWAALGRPRPLTSEEQRAEDAAAREEKRQKKAEAKAAARLAAQEERKRKRGEALKRKRAAAAEKRRKEKERKEAEEEAAHLALPPDTQFRSTLDWRTGRTIVHPVSQLSGVPPCPPLAPPGPIFEIIRQQRRRWRGYRRNIPIFQSDVDDVQALVNAGVKPSEILAGIAKPKAPPKGNKKAAAGRAARERAPAPAGPSLATGPAEGQAQPEVADPATTAQASAGAGLQ